MQRSSYAINSYGTFDLLPVSTPFNVVLEIING